MAASGSNLLPFWTGRRGHGSSISTQRWQHFTDNPPKKTNKKDKEEKEEEEESFKENEEQELRFRHRRNASQSVLLF